MIRNYLTTAVRILTRERLYAVINALGLAVGIATCLLIYSWVSYESGYDNHIAGSDRIFRVVTMTPGSSSEGIASTYPMVLPRLLSQLPGVEAGVRVYDEGFLGTRTRVSYGDKVFTDSRFYYADSSFFRVFPFPILRGSKTPLHAPNGVVLSESAARTYFGEEDPIGKLITAGNREFAVTAVIADIPPDTHFNFDMLASMGSHPWIKHAENAIWSGVVFHTYVRLAEGTDPAEFQKKVDRALADFPDDPKNFSDKVALKLQPVRDIHLRSNLQFELQANGNSTYVRLFITVAVLVLIIAMINYVNLSTARHTIRSKEVGVRKVLGARRFQVMGQFLAESLILTGLAFVLAVALVQFIQPALNTTVGYNPLSFVDKAFWVVTFLFVLGAGLLAGLWPSLVMSSFNPVRLLRPLAGHGAGGVSVRKGLVVFQFTVSILLSICAVVTYRQMRFVQQARLGYDREHVVAVDISFSDVLAKYEVLKSAFLTGTSVTGVAASSQLPVNVQTGENIDVEGGRSLGVNCLSVDPDFFSVMGMELVAGSDLIRGIRPNDTLNYFVLNESALASLGWQPENALVQSMSIRHGNQKPGPVMGVVRDFHYQSLHHEVGPLAIEFNPASYQYLLVRMKGDDIAGTIDFLRERWKEVTGPTPMSYQFLDDKYDELYKSESRTGSLLLTFTAVALLIALLGLFGLSSFAVERRTKEMSIRKVMGAGATQVLGLFSGEIIVLTLAALVLAVPAGYYVMNQWMSSFAYRAPVSLWMFIIAGAFNFLLALGTVVYHGLRVSRVNPASILKYE